MGSDTAISSSMEQELEVQQNTQSALKQRETRAYNLFKLMCNSKGLISKDSLVQAIVREDMVHAQGRGDKNPDEVNEIVQTLLGAMRGHDAANEDVTYAEFLETFRYAWIEQGVYACMRVCVYVCMCAQWVYINEHNSTSLV
jgi:hypothetical protein